jgi:hypothetical protein
MSHSLADFVAFWQVFRVSYQRGKLSSGSFLSGDMATIRGAKTGQKQELFSSFWLISFPHAKEFLSLS